MQALQINNSQIHQRPYQQKDGLEELIFSVEPLPNILKYKDHRLELPAI